MQLKIFFPEVTIAKPKSSRNSSIGRSFSKVLLSTKLAKLKASRALTHLSMQRLALAVQSSVNGAEAFVVCQHYAQPKGFEPADLQRLMQGTSLDYFCKQSVASRRMLVPFLACGDLSGWDADQSYDLPEEGYQTSSAASNCPSL